MKTMNHRLLDKIGAGFYASPFVWGSVMGAVGYLIGNKKDIYFNGLAVATLGGGLTGSLGALGTYANVLQVLNVAISAEIVYYIQNHEF